MGKLCEVNCERELMEKFHQLFVEISEKMKKENPEAAPSFEDFVNCLDTKDKMTKKLFECLIKETMTNASVQTNNSNSTSSSRSSDISRDSSVRTTALLLTTPLSSLLPGIGGTLTLVPAYSLSLRDSSRDSD